MFWTYPTTSPAHFSNLGVSLIFRLGLTGIARCRTSNIMTTTNCCAQCGVAGCASLKTCKSCMEAKYCDATCQRNHWPMHKQDCKLRAAELRDEALFKDPPAKEDCPICFLPMPGKILSCVTLPPATISSVPINYFADAHQELANLTTETYYSCCGKSICGGCVHSFHESGNLKCPFCNADRNKTVEEQVEDNMKRVEANDPPSICLLAYCCYKGLNGVQQDHVKAKELYVRAADLGFNKAHYHLGMLYHEGGNLKKARFHFEAAAMLGDELARNNLGSIEFESGNMERAVTHWTIGASGGDYLAMHKLKICFGKDYVSRVSIDSTLAAYNSSCAEMRSEARDSYIRFNLETM